MRSKDIIISEIFFNSIYYSINIFRTYKVAIFVVASTCMPSPCINHIWKLLNEASQAISEDAVPTTLFGSCTSDDD